MPLNAIALAIRLTNTQQSPMILTKDHREILKTQSLGKFPIKTLNVIGVNTHEVPYENSSPEVLLLLQNVCCTVIVYPSTHTIIHGRRSLPFVKYVRSNVKSSWPKLSTKVINIYRLRIDLFVSSSVIRVPPHGSFICQCYSYVSSFVTTITFSNYQSVLQRDPTREEQGPS